MPAVFYLPLVLGVSAVLAAHYLLRVRLFVITAYAGALGTILVLLARSFYVDEGCDVWSCHWLGAGSVWLLITALPGMAAGVGLVVFIRLLREEPLVSDQPSTVWRGRLNGRAVSLAALLVAGMVVGGQLGEGPTALLVSSVVGGLASGFVLRSYWSVLLPPLAALIARGIAASDGASSLFLVGGVLVFAAPGICAALISTWMTQQELATVG